MRLSEKQLERYRGVASNPTARTKGMVVEALREILADRDRLFAALCRVSLELRAARSGVEADVAYVKETDD